MVILERLLHINVAKDGNKMDLVWCTICEIFWYNYVNTDTLLASTSQLRRFNISWPPLSLEKNVGTGFHENVIVEAVFSWVNLQIFYSPEKINRAVIDDQQLYQ